MRGRLLPLPFLLFAVGCGESAGGDDDDGAGATPDAAPAEAVCDETTGRAVLEGDFACDGAPEVIRVEGEFVYAFDIFKYEASHPLATAEVAFPCAVSKGRAFEAPKQTTPACSKAGVRPWHSVRWEDADKACKAAGEGWRLCKGDELRRACSGPEDYAYTFGASFQTGVCNVREGFVGTDGPSEAPAGTLDGCVSAEGAFDLTGNLWEWTDDRENNDPATRVFQGAGWRTIAERHRDTDLVCGVRNVLPGLSARTYANPDVGFRCCRTASGG